MKFACYNDYELLYLVGEGCERALNLLYHKYNIYVNKVVSSFVSNTDKRNDLVQEGLMVVHKCITSYTDKSKIPLFWYIKISLTRRFMYLVTTTDYYRSKFVLCDSNYMYSIGDKDRAKYRYLRDGTRFFSDKLDLIIYKEHLIEGLSIKALCEKYNVKYHKVVQRRKSMLEEMKKILTN